MAAVIEVAGGRIRGGEDRGTWRFAGVPYAAAPVGSLRWRPPQPVAPWSGVRSAEDFGPIAPQTSPISGLAIPGEPVEQSEDCLALNVWTPGLDGRRPVMIWLHGGSFLSGSGGSVLFRGADLALVGDVVVVTLNYRLGALGFLTHPALADGATGTTAANWALQDQVAALRWVRAHAASFGGDPDNITLFGESAGSMAAAALLAAPSARGLFHRAILQSGPPYTHNIGRAGRLAADFLAVLGLGATVDRRVLESVPAADLVGAAQALGDRPPTPGELPMPFLPVVDGTFLPCEPLEAVAAGAARHVPLLGGSNRDEVSLYSLNRQNINDLDGHSLVERLAEAAPTAQPSDVVAAYEAALRSRGEPATPRAVWTAAATDLVFRWPLLRLAAAQAIHQPATFVYLFTWVTPFMGGQLGSCHGLDLPFVFGGVRHPAIAAFTGGGPEAEALATQMERAWAAFARSGDPSVDADVGGAGAWPRWEPERRRTMVLGPGGGPVEGPRDEELTVWEKLAPLTAGRTRFPSPA